MALSFDWGGLDAGPPVDVTVARLDNVNRWMLTGHVRAYTIFATFGGAGNDRYRGNIDRDVFAVHQTFGVGDRGLTGTNTLDWRDDGTSLGQLSITNSSGNPGEAASNIRAAIAANSLLTADVAGATAAARFSASLTVIPGKILLRLKPLVPMRITEFEMYGAANANTGTTELLLRKNGTTLTNGSLTATPSANTFNTRKTVAAGDATNGDFGTADELTIELNQVSDGLRWLSFRVRTRSAVVP